MSDPKQPQGRWQVTICYLVGGLGGIAVAVGRIVNPIDYPASDFRSTQAFLVGSTIFILAFALLFLFAGLVRLFRRPR